MLDWIHCCVFWMCGALGGLFAFCAIIHVPIRKEATPIRQMCIYRNNMKQQTAPPPATAETRILYPELPAAGPAPGQNHRLQQVNRLKQQLEEERDRRQPLTKSTAVVLMPSMARTLLYSLPVYEWALEVSPSCPPLLLHQAGAGSGGSGLWVTRGG